MATVRFQKLRLDAAVPRYATEGAAGLDVSAALDAPITLTPGERALVPTGLAIALPPRHEAQVRPRSGLRQSTASPCSTPPAPSTKTTAAK
ncbi:MAG: hypothetical protein R3A78_13985 [Polyangiales bacterium]